MLKTKSVDRKFLRILKYLFFLTIIILLIPTIQSFIPGEDEFDIVFIPNTDFKADTFYKLDGSKAISAYDYDMYKKITEPAFESNFHWLKEGQKYALLYRFFNQGGRTTKDDEQFKMMTIVTPTIDPGEYTIDNKNVRGYYTEGPSAWPNRQRSGPIENGKLIIVKHNPQELTVQVKFSGTYGEIKRREVNFDQELKFKETSFANATPWLGKKGDSIYSETYRK